MDTANASATILILKLDSAETIITHAIIDETIKVIRCHVPALLVHERLTSGVIGFVLKPWVPMELLHTPDITLMPNQVAGYMVASPELTNFYRIWATIEVEHLKEFESEYKSQITKLTKSYAEAYAASTAERAANRSTHDVPDDALIRMFEENSDWGDSTKVH